MPDKNVETIRDLIYYQYAKLIARSAFKALIGVGINLTGKRSRMSISMSDPKGPIRNQGPTPVLSSVSMPSRNTWLQEEGERDN